MPATPLQERLARLDWDAIERDLDQQGNALIPGLLDHRECTELSDHYSRQELFRAHVLMARHGFGRGEYKYFRYPLPERIGDLREQLYRHLAPQANRWNEQMNLPITYPVHHADFIARCHAAGQQRPTPLLLQYGPGDYNCLHQDLYGEHVFPLQVAILLSQPGEDFAGGELVLTEQRPRMQSRAQVVHLNKGDAVIFAVNQRPMPGVRGFHRVTLRHGVSVLHSGTRHTLGVIFHDAQ
ncbi:MULTISPECIES: 2OG-Fe(II) oxygenase [unclassified Pseudomonas]|uniref:2OG-Fe(II) oxygenase n=1 Tax=unclassified Pseudomonas TaxID=196821 RepID=UPI0015A00663|nr:MULTISPECIES: 2OG-Fe(II) oxygenase [unclassified Pseudomonas]NWC91827.1 2OG-Fe(II) oxygenase [Pseudomonas sp. IPO3779]NWD20699.1 2OG-Fe(II) oxygenase [Pseudomonas sp. IPO3778]